LAIQPSVGARYLRHAPEVAVILYGDEGSVELGGEDLIRDGDGSEDLRPLVTVPASRPVCVVHPHFC